MDSELKHVGCSLFAAIGTIFLVMVLVIGLSWIVQGNEFFLYKVFAPRTEAMRREVFEQSKAFNQGMVQELQNMQLNCQLNYKAFLMS